MQSTTYRLNLTWGISKIIAPNGRTVNFKYKRKTAVLNTNDDNPPIYAQDLERNYHPTSGYYSVNYSGPSYSAHSSSKNYSINKIESYKLYISSIEIDNGTSIKFKYVEGQKEKYYSGSLSLLTDIESYPNLSQIFIYNANKIIKAANLTYISSENENHITFLNNVKLSGIGEYHFEYNTSNGYPYLGTAGYDHWGYYNDPNYPYVPSSFCSYDNNYNETINSNIREPSFNHAKIATLKKIIYPTGGYSELEYESHTYSKSVIRHSDNGFVPKLTDHSANKIAGGVRIKRIVSHSNDNSLCDTISYKYNLDNTTGLSSGILITPPRYGIVYRTSNGIKDVGYYNTLNFIITVR